ncbi:chemotaxis protein CheW [Eubacteriaceae bacterium ES3]|nr:chemotaxis protein CheW [Eubacteriaceae bacterium ES3]
MIIYKNKDFLSHMQDVMDYDKRISELNSQWDNIKLLCEINCPIQSKNVLPNVTSIQKSFFSLKQELIDTLISEKLRIIEQKIISKTQVQIDLLIRNLYERTADVGFLAMDDDIRNFIKMDSRTDDALYQIQNRLKEYVAKYSVYDEIIILDQNNQVIANLDPDNPILNMIINDPIIETTRTTSDSFVEAFQKSDLRPNKERAHIFTSKITDKGATIGVICLCFRFENEMDGIFSKLTRDYDGSVISIIDTDNKVIASSDPNHVPLGVTVEPVDPGVTGIEFYHGISSISKTVPTNGYQGYMGLGWRGHIMLPLNIACHEKDDLTELNETIREKLLSLNNAFSDKLGAITLKTESINSALRRIVYNGQIIARDESLQDEYTRLKPLLRAIGRIGTETSDLFQSSVTGLFSTVVSNSLIDSKFTASLCVEIMDRNLYERANDCRWWALNSTFRQLLAKDRLIESEKSQLTDILVYINGLYTVYTNLFLFDQTGTILAVSNPKCSEDIGKTLNDQYIKNILYNSQPELYFVSPFEQTDLYDSRPTYIYGASVTDIDHPGRVVGGIGIAFDSEDQFQRILEESISESTYALFTDRNKTIIASTNPNHPVGSSLQLDNDFFTIENGSSVSRILNDDGSYTSVGCACSSSYREYKESDGYQNDILAFVFVKLADTSTSHIKEHKSAEIEQVDIYFSMNDPFVKLATFSIDGQMYGLDQSYVLEALDMEGVISMPGISGPIKGAVEYEGNFITVVSLSELFNNQQDLLSTSSLLVLQLSETERIALQVDQLNNVLEINLNQIRTVGISSSVTGIFSPEDAADQTILVLDHQILYEKLMTNELAADFLQNLPLLQQ